MRADPSLKIQSSCQYIFLLLGSEPIKAARKMLVHLVFAGDPDAVVEGVVDGGNLSLVGDDSMRENDIAFLPT